MNKSVLGIVVVLAIIAIGGFLYFERADAPTEELETTSNEQTEAITAAPNENAGQGASLESDMIEDIVVTYTDNGFEPKAVSVNAGQTVRFVNQSSRGMWVGTDPHPAHTGYPEKTAKDCKGSAFDACKTIAAGQSWSFTFNQKGTWGYHNHVQTRDVGTITVR